MSDVVNPGSPNPDMGRLFLVTSEDPDIDPRAVGVAVARRLPRAVAVDGPQVAAMVVAGSVTGDSSVPSLAAMEQLLLRYSACIAIAETYQHSGFDAVVTDRLDIDRLEDFLDFVAPAPVRVVTLTGTPDLLDAAPAEGDAGAPDEARDPDGYDDEQDQDDADEALFAALREVEYQDGRPGLTLDVTGLTLDAVTEQVLRGAEAALVDTSDRDDPDGEQE